MLDGLIATSPRNRELLLLGAEMHASFGFAFLEEEDRDYALDAYARAREYGMRALTACKPELGRALEEAPASWAQALEADLADAASDERVRASLFWLGFAWGSTLNLSRSDPRALSDLWRVELALKVVLEADETFHDAGPHLFFALRYASFARAMGGDPERARAHFEAVDRITGGRHLLAKVLRAQYYAPLLQETKPGATVSAILAAQRAAWDEFFPPLVAVLQSKPDLWPERNLMNAVARRRARTLLERPSLANIIPPPDVKNPYERRPSEEDE
jgi:hypothetical protein